MEQVRIGVFVRKGRGGGVFGVVVEPGLATPPPPAAYMLTLSFSGPTVAQRRFRFGHQASQSGKGQGPFARILYINMDHRMDRRKHMESWLSRESPVPYRRVRAHAGNESSQCVPGKQSPARCRGIAGLASTLVRTIDQLEGAAGDTLILEDDVYVRVAELRRHVARVPDDWEVIRFDCFGYVPPSFKFVEDDIFEPRHIRPCSARSLKLNTSYPKEAHCWFCGGTFAMLIRESSRSKLRKIWSRQPNDDPDCILSRGWWPYQDGFTTDSDEEAKAMAVAEMNRSENNLLKSINNILTYANNLLTPFLSLLHDGQQHRLRQQCDERERERDCECDYDYDAVHGVQGGGGNGGGRFGAE